MKIYLLTLILIPSLCFSHITRQCIENGWIVWKTDTGWVLEYKGESVFIPRYSGDRYYIEEQFCNGVKQ